MTSISGLYCLHFEHRRSTRHMTRLYYPPPERAKASSGGKPTKEQREAAQSGAIADATEKIVKIIPSEIIVLYSSAIGLAQLLPENHVRIVSIIVFALALGLTWFAVNRLAQLDGQPFALRDQKLSACAAFPVWAYLVSGSYVVPEIYHPAYPCARTYHSAERRFQRDAGLDARQFAGGRPDCAGGSAS